MTQQAFRPPDTEPLAQRLYDFIWSSVFYAITNFSKDSRGAALGGYKIAHIIRQAAEDAVDDAYHLKKHGEGK